jgi:hypothetical protein
MREYKIIVDLCRNQPYECYERSYFSFFPSQWELIETTPTHAEAISFVQSKDGRYIGTYKKDGTRLKVDEVVKMDKDTTYSHDGLPVKKTTALHSIPMFDDDKDVVNDRKVRLVKK